MRWLLFLGLTVALGSWVQYTKGEGRVRFTLSSSVVPVDSYLSFNWTLLDVDEVYQSDWIGIFRWKDQSSRKDYVNEALGSIPTEGWKKGTSSIKVPSRQGNYVLRYIFGATNVSKDVSPPFMAIDCSTATSNAYSAIKHVVLIVQENHSFDTYFSTYCKAATGSNPDCTEGPQCCETGPTKDPGSGMEVTELNDYMNGIHDPDHSYDCEVGEIDGGKMDKFVKGLSCSDIFNFAYANTTTAESYQKLAAQYAMADHYFQPIAGATASNNMYLVRAEYMFTDNECFPDHAIGTQCNTGNYCPFDIPNIGDMFRVCNISYTAYAGGYGEMVDTVNANKTCPTPPADCPAHSQYYPCTFDASDIPFQYFPNLRDQPQFIKDLDSEFFKAVQSGTLPTFSYVKPIGYKTEHPGSMTTVTTGESTVMSVVDAILNSTYAQNTLVLVTFDEGGGYFDHISPPADSTVDGKPYGTRIPMIAVGYFAKNNYISHVVSEHSSVVKFLEWNYWNQTGQLETRDAVVNHITSLLNLTKTGPLPA